MPPKPPIIFPPSPSPMFSPLKESGTNPPPPPFPLLPWLRRLSSESQIRPASPSSATSMDPISMDAWCFEDDNHHSSSSSGSLPQIPFGGYWSSFSSIDDIYIPEIPPENGVDRLELGVSELLNSSAQPQRRLDELNMLMDSTDSTGQASGDIFQNPQFLQSSLLYHSPLQTLHGPPLLPSNRSCSFDSSSSIYMTNNQPMQQTSSAAPMNQHSDARFSLAAAQEMEITRAMVSVISSSSTSSSSAAPSYQHKSQQSTQTWPSRANCHLPKMSSFHPYCSSICQKLEAHKNVHSQNMIKKAHIMLRRVNMLKGEDKVEETQLSAYQMQHMVLERRRRERLNSSFHSLWELLPPGSKKDKTSVLCKTVSYMKTLKAEIYELEEKNRALEEHVVLPFEVEEGSINPNERVTVTITESSRTKPEMHHRIDLFITVRVQCDLIQVVLHVLECIKTMETISLLSLDAIPNTQQFKLFAILKLAIQGSTWDEGTFKEAINGAAQKGLTVTA